MAKRTNRLERVDVPPACYEIKAQFPARPTPEIVSEIKEWIKQGNDPHLWWGHTHTRPAKNSAFLYLDEFDLPVARLKAGRLAPCPCCTPEHPKYGRNGKIAWYPGEAVIRLLGPNCFATLNRGAHQAAVEQLRIEQRVAADVRYLLLNLPKLPEAIAVISAWLPVAEDVEVFHRVFHTKGKDAIRPYLGIGRTGRLTIWEQTTDLRLTRSGDVQLEDIDEERLYAEPKGLRMFGPKTPILVGPIRTALTALHDVRRHLQPQPGPDGTLDWETTVNGLADDRRHQLAANLTRDLKAARDALERMEELRRFVSPLTMNTLRAWGLHPGNRMPYNFQLAAGEIRLGRTDAVYMRIPIPEGMLAPLEKLEFWLAAEV